MMIWPVGRLVWESKGQKMENVSLVLTQELGPGYSISTLQRLTAQTREEMPEHVVAVIRALPVMPKSEDTAEVVRLGLAALEKGPIVDPEALAASLAAMLPRMDPEVIALAVTAKLAAPLESANAKLDVLRPTLDHADAKADLAELKRDKDKRAILRTIWASCAASVVASFVFARCQQAPTAAPAPIACVPAPAPMVVNIGWGGVEEAAKAQQSKAPGVSTPFTLFMGAPPAGELGKRLPLDQYIPVKPMPYQRPPPCMTEASEEEINGTCWQRTDRKPPCGRMLFRNGDMCYRPIAADPRQPVLITPDVPEQEPR